MINNRPCSKQHLPTKLTIALRCHKKQFWTYCLIEYPSRNEIVFAMSRKTKILTVWIHWVSMGTLQCIHTSEPDLSACYAQAGAEIAENSNLWMETYSYNFGQSIG